jgi:hypothetical protein
VFAHVASGGAWTLSISPDNVGVATPSSGASRKVTARAVDGPAFATVMT